jgi:hypothetical protein
MSKPGQQAIMTSHTAKGGHIGQFTGLPLVEGRDARNMNLFRKILFLCALASWRLCVKCLFKRKGAKTQRRKGRKAGE